jgi:hypothetical protein
LNRKYTCKSADPDNEVVITDFRESLKNKKDVTQSSVKMTNSNNTTNNIETFNNINNISNVFNIMIDGKSNILTNDDIVSMVLNGVTQYQYGKSDLYNRIEHKDNLKVGKFDMHDIAKITDRVTKTTDFDTLKDAYYAYDSINKNYMMRVDIYDDGYKHEWHWKCVKYKDIWNDISFQVYDHILKWHEMDLTNQYIIDKTSKPFERFYRILKACRVKPRCASVHNDKQLLHTYLDSEYYEESTSNICEELREIYNSTILDSEIYVNFHDNILNIIENNGVATFTMIKNKVEELINAF